MRKKLVCTVCPLGCVLLIRVEDGEIVVEGNRCPRGEEYAKKEIVCPHRNFFAVVMVKNGVVPTLSVRSTKPVPKDKILILLKLLSNVVVEAPVTSGQVIVKRPLGLDTDLIATRSVRKAA